MGSLGCEFDIVFLVPSSFLVQSRDYSTGSAGRRLSPRITRRRLGSWQEIASEGSVSEWNAGKRMSLRVTCRSWWETEYEGGMLVWNAGKRMSLRVTCWLRTLETESECCMSAWNAGW